MVIDTSALVAILQREPERRAFIEAIEAADARLMSVATFVEISIVIEARHGRKDCAISITSSPGQASSSYPLTRNTAKRRAARSAASAGDGIVPALNYGDCFSYALAIPTGEPLLFKGDEFVHTDVTAVNLADEIV